MRPFVRQALTVARKEIRDHSRDRRAVLVALLTPLLGPLALALVFQVVAKTIDPAEKKPIAATGQAEAPHLVAFLDRQGVKLIAAPEDARDKVASGDLDVLLVIPESFADNVRAGRPAHVQVWSDSSRPQGRVAAMRLAALVNGFGAETAQARLAARGVAPDLIHAVVVSEKDVATPQKGAGVILGAVPSFLLLAVFAGGMYVAIDVTAGERERGSLEPLLLCPAPRGAIVLGKWLATLTAALFALVVCLAAFVVAMRVIPFETIGLSARFGLKEGAIALLVLAPLAALAAAVEMLASTFARSFKEGQTYLQIVLLLPFAPTLYLAVAPAETTLGRMFVPVLAQNLLTNDLLRGTAPGPGHVALAALAPCLGAIACLWIASRLLRRETIIFGR